MDSLPLRMVVLGSGSSGNATAVTDGNTTVLVDCGFSAREVSRRLAQAGIAASSVAAVLVTHEHGDHVRGIDVFCRRHAPSCTVMGSRGTVISAGLACPAGVMAVAADATFSVGTLSIAAFRTSHDAAEPLGYRIESEGRAVGIATDTGVITAEMREALSGCEIVGIESNHDVEMLDTGPYPVYLKRRIRSALGHLSNEHAADAVESLAHDGLSRVIALHRSRTNNTERLAAASLKQRLRRIGLPVPVLVASQEGICDSHPPQTSLFDASV